MNWLSKIGDLRNLNLGSIIEKLDIGDSFSVFMSSTGKQISKLSVSGNKVSEVVYPNGRVVTTISRMIKK
jgi:hypothetical protein